MNIYPIGTSFETSSYTWPQLHAHTIWTRYTTILLGVWLLVTLATFGMTNTQMAWSDAVSGILLIVLGYLSLSPQRLWAPWLICLVGIWLQVAPLIFWSPTAFGYLNDTGIGILAIALSIVIPGTPGVVEDQGAETPLGWSYNPSSWVQRLPIIFLACVCWFTARYMAAYQLGYIHSIGDPLFPNGTLNVITSDISKSFPVSDAGLGAAAYTIEALMGCKGGTRRWRTMPWIVTLFGILVVPVGLTSIVLIMLQPLVVGSWCFWCLLTAVCMLIMVALTIDEVVATIQYVRQRMKQGASFWETFWKGGPAISESQGDNYGTFLAPPTKGFWLASVRGVSIPWWLVLTAGLGAWLMFYVGDHRLTDNLDHIYGALIVTFSIISMAEVIRSARWINVLLGIAVAVTPFLTKAPSGLMGIDVAVGLLVILLSIPRGPLYQRYGTLDSAIR